MEYAVEFDEDVSETLDGTDMTMERYDEVAGWLAVDVSAASISYDGATDTATWDFSAIGFQDAYHRALLIPVGITDMAGNDLDPGHSYLFHRLAGDANADAIANVGDLGIVGANYRQSGNWWELPGDFNCDGLVNVADLGILGANYRRTLTPPPPGGGSDEVDAEAPAVAAVPGGISGREAGLGAVGAGSASGEAPARGVCAGLLAPRAGSNGAAPRRLGTTVSQDADGPDAQELLDVLALSRLGTPLGF
jgi:hypothetical protein